MIKVTVKHGAREVEFKDAEEYAQMTFEEIKELIRIIAIELFDWDEMPEEATREQRFAIIRAATFEDHDGLKNLVYTENLTS